MQKNALVIALVLLTCANPGSVLAIELADYEWRNRLLVLLAPRVDDPVAVQQRSAIEKRDAALIDRDLIVIELYQDGQSRVGQQRISTTQALELRREFDAEPDTSAMLLIGKDGNVKRRAPLGSSLREIFEQIDAMPMRRSEIRDKINAGEPVTKP